VTGAALVDGTARIVVAPSMDGRVRPANSAAHVEFLSEGIERPPKSLA